MISNSGKNPKMNILQNTSVFTVEMHFDDLNNITATLTKNIFFIHIALAGQRTKFDPPLDLKNSFSSRPKTSPRPPKSDT